MKKSKKLLSLFLAALMLMSCFGAISASAMTMEAAEQAAQEFNESIPDHSDVYANKSAKEWNKTMTDLDKTLGAVLKQVNIKESLYTNDTVNMLMKDVVGGLLTTLTNAGGMGATIGRMGQPAASAKYITNEKFAAIAEYLKTCPTWADVDTSKIDWGITPGDRAAFEEAATTALDFPLVTLWTLGSALLRDIFNEAIGLLEALHQGPGMAYEDLTNMTVFHTDKVAWIVTIVCDAVDDLEANPIEYLCEILPDLTNCLPAVMDAVKTNSLLGGALGDVSLPNGLADIIDMVIPMLPGMLGLGEDYVMPALNLPEIDENYLITMGKAVATESGMKDGARMAIEGNSTMVFASVAQYVQEVLQDKNNQAAIGDLIVAKFGAEYLENYRAVVDAALNGTSIDVADACLSFVEDYANNVLEQEDVNPIVAFFAKIAAFFSNLAKKIMALFK